MQRKHGLPDHRTEKAGILIPVLGVFNKQQTLIFSTKLFVRIASLLFALICSHAILYFGVPQEIATASRYSYSFFLIAAFIPLYFSYSSKGAVGSFTAFTLTLALFSLPLARLWHTGASESFLLGGLLPWNDATTYYLGARSLLNGDLMPTIQRPLFSGLLATILGLTGQNLQLSIWLLLVLAAMSTHLAAREIQKTLGTAPAVLIIIGLFLYYRTYTGETMTENLGFPLGILGSTVIWSGARLKNQTYILVGLFVLAFALNVRVGTLFVLPAIILWGSFIFSKKTFSWRFLFLSIFAVLFALGLNLVVYKATCPKENALPFSNYSYTLYGLLTQTNWYRVVEENPRLKDLDEAHKSKAIFDISIALLKNKPMKLFEGMLKALHDLFFGYFTLFMSEGPNITGENPLKLVEPLFRILSLIGFVVCCFTFRKVHSSLTLYSVFGFVFSCAFVPIWDAGSRTYAATIMFPYIAVACGLAFVIRALQFAAVRVVYIFKTRGAPSYLLSWGIPILGLCTFPCWYYGFSGNTHVRLKMAAPGAEYARVYWEDPQHHPNSYRRIALNPSKSVNWVVTIESLKKKNAKAKGSSVWLTEIKTTEGRIDLTKGVSIGPPWEYRKIAENPWAVAAAPERQTLTLQFRGGDLSIQFIRSLWSGFGRLTVNSHVQEFDLYDESGVKNFKFPAVIPGDQVVRDYDLLVPNSGWGKILIVAEENKEIRVKEATIDGKVSTKSGVYFVVPYPLGSRLNFSLFTSVVLCLSLLAFIRSLHNWPDKFIHSKQVSFRRSWKKHMALQLGLFLIFVSFFGPLTIRVFSRSPNLPDVSCPNHKVAFYRINPGTSINIVDDHSIQYSKLPNIRISDFRRGLQTLSPWLPQAAEKFRELHANTTIVDPLGYLWLVMETNKVPTATGGLVACGEEENMSDVSILKAKTIQFVK